MKLEKVTLECIQDTLKTIQDTTGKPFYPRECVHTLTEQILAILVDIMTALTPSVCHYIKILISCEEIGSLDFFTWVINLISNNNSGIQFPTVTLLGNLFLPLCLFRTFAPLNAWAFCNIGWNLQTSSSSLSEQHKFNFNITAS